MSRVVAEVAIDSVQGAIAAAGGDADRVELSSGLEIGGLSPSIGLIRQVVATLPTHVLVRPRAGDFCYDRSERATIERDINEAFAAGASGVVVGALTPQGDIDRHTLDGFLQAAAGQPVYFHRAFDMCRGPYDALEVLLDSGITGLLTSGQRRTAAAGVDLLAGLIARSGSRLAVTPASGVTPANAAFILSKTGAKSIHFSARQPIGSAMIFRNPAVSMGKESSDEYARNITSSLTVRAIVEAVRGFSASEQSEAAVDGND
ncbi:MAG: copper homeostasis protein CutC [Actinomycetota bacterium]|nr:copper homeostasis protein CutC [Actinomycetota bacterium]